MNLRNTAERYGTLSMLLHWGMALIMIGLLALGLTMTELPDGDPKWQWYGLHKSFGMLIPLLAVVRVWWLTSHPRPELPDNLQPWEKIAAHATHGLLYLSMFLLPLSGYVDSSAGGYHLSFFGLFDVPKFIPKSETLEQIAVAVHETLAYGLMAVLALHLGAVAKHHLILKDGVLRRMLPW